MEGAAIASWSLIFWNTAMVIVVKRKFGFYILYPRIESMKKPNFLTGGAAKVEQLLCIII